MSNVTLIRQPSSTSVAGEILTPQWVAYTPVISASSGTIPTHTTNFFYKLFGDTMDISGVIQFTGTSTFTAPTFTLPSPFTIKTSVAPDLSATGGIIGPPNSVNLWYNGSNVFPGAVGAPSNSNTFPLNYWTPVGGFVQIQGFTETTPFSWTSAGFITIRMSSIPVQ